MECCHDRQKSKKMTVAGHSTWIYQSESGFTKGCGSCFCWTNGFKYQTFGFKHPKYGFHQQNMGLDFWISPGFFHQPKQKKIDQQHREIQQSLQGPLFGWSLRMRFRTHRQGPTVVAWHRGFGGGFGSDWRAMGPWPPEVVWRKPGIAKALDLSITEEPGKNQWTQLIASNRNILRHHDRLSDGK